MSILFESLSPKDNQASCAFSNHTYQYNVATIPPPRAHRTTCMGEVFFGTWHPLATPKLFFGGSILWRQHSLQVSCAHTDTHLRSIHSATALPHAPPPPPTLFPVHRTHTRLRLTLLARRWAQNPQPAQKEKGIKKSFKLSGIMPPTQEVIRLTKGVHHLSQGLRVMLWQFTFLTPFNAHLQPVEGSQQVKEAAVKETTPFIFLRKRWDLHGALSNVTGHSGFFRTFGKGTLRRWVGPCISKSVLNVTNSDGVYFPEVFTQRNIRHLPKGRAQLSDYFQECGGITQVGVLYDSGHRWKSPHPRGPRDPLPDQLWQ